MDIINNNSIFPRSLTGDNRSIILIGIGLHANPEPDPDRRFPDLLYETHDCDTAESTAAVTLENQATSSIQAFRACPA
jgi:hypothetical protein